MPSPMVHGYSHQKEIRDIPLISVKAQSVVAIKESTSHWNRCAGCDWSTASSRRDRVMLITIIRLYDSYSDANRVVLMLEAAGVSPSETSVISNNSDSWYSAMKTASVVPARTDGASTQTDGKVEGAVIGAAIGATAATAASLVTMLA